MEHERCQRHDQPHRDQHVEKLKQQIREQAEKHHKEEIQGKGDYQEEEGRQKGLEEDQDDDRD